MTSITKPHKRTSVDSRLRACFKAVMSITITALSATSSYAAVSTTYSCDPFKNNPNVYQNCLNIQQTTSQIKQRIQDNYSDNIQQSQPYTATPPPPEGTSDGNNSTTSAVPTPSSQNQAQDQNQQSQAQPQYQPPDYKAPDYGDVPLEAGPYVQSPAKQPSQQPQVKIPYN